MKVTPLHDRLIVQRLDEGEQRVGGIIVPDSAKEKPQERHGLRRGTGQGQGRRQPPAARREERRHDPVREYSGQEIKIDGEDYLIMREDDVLAIIDSK